MLSLSHSFLISASAYKFAFDFRIYVHLFSETIETYLDYKRNLEKQDRDFSSSIKFKTKKASKKWKPEKKAACRTWTHDPEITNHVLYQLS